MPLPILVVGGIALVKAGIEAYQKYSKTPAGKVMIGAATIAAAQTAKDPKVKGHAQQKGAEQIGEGLGRGMFPNHQALPPQP